jgi:hypothetical protein
MFLKKRKAMDYRIIITINLILLSFRSLSGQSDSETRNFTRTFPAGKETSLEVINKYGTLHITTWKKDSIFIKAEVKAYATNHSRLNKMFDGININFTDTRYLVRVQTDFTQNINMLFESFKGMTSKLISYDSHIEINYFISIPEYLDLKLENKYGDIYMEDLTGDFSVSLTNGSFKANSLNRVSLVTLAFCDAKINSLKSGKIDASFSEITIGETEDLTISSISTRFDIKKAGVINCESRKDKFFLGNIDILKGNSYFTDFRVNNLKKEINITSKYGSLNTDLVEKGFDLVNINSVYSDISLEFDPVASYNLDVRHVNSFMVLPDKNIKSEEKAINEDKKEFVTYGTVGKNPGTSKVKIDATRGNIYLK